MVGDLTVVIIGGLELGHDAVVSFNFPETQPILCGAKSKHERRVIDMQYEGVRLQEPHGIFGLRRTLWHHDLAWVCRHRVRGVMELKATDFEGVGHGEVRCGPGEMFCD